MQLAHIIAVSRHPAEIEEITVPEAKAKERVATLEKRFETVFIYRTFEATKESPWAVK
jgi:hypothetical protein